MIVFFETEEDYRRGDEALNAMSMGDTPGRRTSVTKYEVAARMSRVARVSRPGGAGAPEGVLADLWYKNALVYSLDVETFMDANGDGVGDFEGLMRRLDYLESLGVDVALARAVPALAEPRQRLRHRRLLRRRPALRLRGRLRRVRAPGAEQRHPRHRRPRRQPHLRPAPVVPRGARRPRVAAPRLVRVVEEAARRPGARAWSSRASSRPRGRATRRRKQWYFHRFFDFQPDLNMQNPAVREEIRRIMGYWLELGVSGFRVDAVPFIIEEPPTGDGARRSSTSSTSRSCATSSSGASATPSCSARRTCCRRRRRATSRGGDGMHLMFNFWVNQHLFVALASGDARPLAEGAARHGEAAAELRSGRTSCATTTSSTSAA